MITGSQCLKNKLESEKQGVRYCRYQAWLCEMIQGLYNFSLLWGHSKVRSVSWKFNDANSNAMTSCEA